MHIWEKTAPVSSRALWEERLLWPLDGNPNLVCTERPGHKSFRMEVYCGSLAEARGLQKKFGGKITELKEQNWAALVPPPPVDLKIRDCLLVTARASEDERAALVRESGERRQVISIPPQLAFGTGDHATTSTCLRMLVDIAREIESERCGRSWDFLDLGTGTGILAIAARLLGAGSAEAWDYDPRAVGIGRANAELNGVSGIQFLDGDVTDTGWSPGHTFPFLAANMFSDILIRVFPKMAGCLEPGGRIIISGILREQEDAVMEAGRCAGIEMESIIRRGKWVSGRGRRL